MIGVVIILVVMVLVGPFAVFVGGAIWSALIGWLYVQSTEPAVVVDNANQG